ncbi:MAG: ABC transporter ATP-binding protein [Clostridia bacterium]|nr:ABC transporter ATP-binding protein [Clostridia bacterium]
MSQPILICEKLSKSYKKGVVVLDELDFCVEPGKIVGLLGPNGCGKSTLLKLISGLLTPDSGSITVCGQERSEQTNAHISFLPERPYFSSGMTVNAMLDYFEDFYEDFDRSLATVMLKDLEIDPAARMRTLSKGTKEKVQLILVMARRAKLYLLDEPIGGVDPAARDYILKTIIGNYNPEASVIITTHLIADVESVLDDFAFVDKGKIAMYGNADQTREQHGTSLDELFREVFRCSRNA